MLNSILVRAWALAATVAIAFAGVPASACQCSAAIVSCPDRAHREVVGSVGSRDAPRRSCCGSRSESASPSASCNKTCSGRPDGGIERAPRCCGCGLLERPDSAVTPIKAPLVKSELGAAIEPAPHPALSSTANVASAVRDRSPPPALDRCVFFSRLIL